MGQVPSLPEGEESREAIVEGGNFTEIGGNHEGNESSFESFSESVQTMTEDFERNGNKGQQSIISSDLETKKPARHFLLQPSSPSEWIDAFRTSTNDELISLLEEGLSLENDHSTSFCDLTPLCKELRFVASRIQKYRAFQKTMGLNMEAHPGTILSQNHSDSSAICFYNFRPSSDESSRNTGVENDGDLIDLCERILEASSSHASQHIQRKNRSKSNNENTTRKPMLTLSRVRQKLVPSKLKEHIFWESLWVLLYERKKLRQQQAFFERIKYSTNDNDFNANNHHDDTGEKAYNNNRIEILEEELNAARWHISGLIVRYNAETREREEMEKLIEKMWQMIPRNHEKAKLSQSASVISLDPKDTEKNSSTTTQHSSCHHTGDWIMTKDSIEFLAYPSEAKEALRSEKQKRLKRVMEEMAFILDSDHPKDSHGEWSCCNKTDYNAACGPFVGE